MALQVLIICGFFITHVGALVYVQTVNYIQGMTTNERLSKSRVIKRRKGNCIEMCREKSIRLSQKEMFEE